MADEFTYTNYQVEDIERYLGGRMNAKDMHDMERAALQDPFLADAIEGLQQQPFAQTYQHLDEIAIAIQGEKEPAKIVVLPVKRNYWWRVAAVIIGFVIIAGAALWYVQSSNMAENKAISAAITPEKPQQAPAATPSKVANGDTVIGPTTTMGKKSVTAVGHTKVGTNNELVAENSQTDIQFKPGTLTANYDTIKGGSVVRAAAPVTAEANTNAADLLQKLPGVDVGKDGNIKQDTALDKKLAGVVAGVNVNTYTNNAPNIKRTGPTANELNITANNVGNNTLLNNIFSKNKSFATVSSKFEGFVVDDKNKPLAEATVYTNDKKHVTLTDGKGYFALNTTDSQLAVQVASAGYRTKQVLLKINTPNYILVNQDDNLLNEVTVTEFKNTHLAKKIQADSLFPEGGWQSFREYVYKKLHKEKDMDTTGAVITSLDKSVEIEFVVDENGLAQDLKIIKSLNSESDAKALEVVQQWPHWIATRKDKKGKVVIQF